MKLESSPTKDQDEGYWLREINSALFASSVRQHELMELALQTQKALRESEMLRRQALDAADLGTWNLDIITGAYISDARFKAISGCSEEGPNKDEWIGKIHPMDQERVRAAVQAATRPENPQVYEVEYHVIYPDGTVHWVQANGSAKFEDDGTGPKLVSFAGTVADVTDRKTIEEALKESEARFRLMAEAMPQKIFTANREGAVTYFNPQWKQYSGQAFSEIKDWGWLHLVHPDDIDASLISWRESISTGRALVLEHRFLRSDGEYRWHLTRSQPMRNELGEILSWVGSSTDIDDAKRSEEAIRSELEEEVILRTKELVEINEQLQGFTYSVAHDLRQHIRGVNANASILLEDMGEDLNKESLSTLNRLVDSSLKLSKLVDDLLSYARLGRQEPQKEALDLTAMAHEIAESIVNRGLCREGTQFKIDKELTAKGDSQLIRIALENLIENACKYTGKVDNPTVEIGRGGEAFYVRDNGVGFDMQFTHKLFQPFERLHPMGSYSGTGVGLANVRRIIEKHGGRVWAEGRPENGATFYFNLP